MSEETRRCIDCESFMIKTSKIYDPEKYKIDCLIWVCDCGMEIMDNNQSSYIDSMLALAKNKEIKELTIDLAAEKAKVAIAVNSIRGALQYIEHNEDNLSGSDCVGDNKLTLRFKARVKELEQALNDLNKEGGEG